MNWLVHLAVAPADAEHRVGQVLADVLHPRDRAGLGAGVQRGVASHIAIDRFTDRHAAVARSRARVRAPWRRYAGILVDVLYGHLLVRRWDTHLAEPFERFGDAIYAEFLSVSPALPADAAAFTRRFAEERWLEAYRDEAGLRRLLRGIAGRLERRFGRAVPMAEALPVLLADADAFLEEFDEFFPALQRAAAAD